MQYPEEIVDTYNEECITTDQEIIGQFREFYTPPSSLAKATETFRIRHLWGRIHVSLYTDVTLGSPSHPTYRTRVDDFRGELDNWRKSVPHLQPQQGDALTIFSGPHWYDICYNYTILFLYRGLFDDDREDPPGPILFDCMKSAENICRSLRLQMLDRKTTFTWGVLHIVFLAGLTYLHCLWSSPAVRGATRHDVVSNTCTDCTIVLVLMAQWHEAVAPYRDIFDALASRTMTMLVDRNCDGPLHFDSSLDPGSKDSTDLIQLMDSISGSGLTDGFDKFLTNLINDSCYRQNELRD